ncbi:unnamed protein product [Strongylus vulgaris]|uniref:Uncharacterized protein n=1 Tax=Strongylus vulgaris TaxID=40348 RepID=A0A3P7IXN8_STRVU|nr:unnamed protein product [Strongylus vulgaris]
MVCRGRIESEPLALAIAEEWASQEQNLHMAHMRLTGLAFTAQDNPLHLTRLPNFHILLNLSKIGHYEEAVELCIDKLGKCKENQHNKL